MDAVQIKIAKPCHENWDNMSATEKGRFCNSCEKEVIDFTTMSDGEMIKYLSSIKEKELCGNALIGQLDRPIYKLKERRKPLAWYWNYAMMMLLFFSKSTAKAQMVKGKVATRPIKENVPALLPNTTPSCIKDATDTIKNQIPEKQAVTNQQIMLRGGMSIINPDPLYVIDGKMVEGVKVLEKLNPNDIESIEILKDAKATAIYGSSAATGVIIIKTKKRSVKDIPKKIVNKITDTLKITNHSSSLKIYPNPVAGGEVFNVELKFKTKEVVTMQVIDVAGNIVFQKQISGIRKIHNEQLLSDSKWSSGAYFIKIINSKNDLISTGRFILE